MTHNPPAGSLGDAAHRSRVAAEGQTGLLQLGRKQERNIGTVGTRRSLPPSSTARLNSKCGYISHAIWDILLDCRSIQALNSIRGSRRAYLLHSTFRTRSHDAEYWISGTAATRAMPPLLPQPPFFSVPLAVRALHRISGVSTVSRPPFDSEPAPLVSYERPCPRSVTASR